MIITFNLLDYSPLKIFFVVIVQYVIWVLDLIDFKIILSDDLIY